MYIHEKMNTPANMGYSQGQDLLSFPSEKNHYKCNCNNHSGCCDNDCRAIQSGYINCSGAICSADDANRR